MRGIAGLITVVNAGSKLAPKESDSIFCHVVIDETA